MQLRFLSWLLIAIANAQYELQSTFAGLTFFDNFGFYTSWDPTYGYVHYVDQPFAQQNGMINITNTSVSWGVDTTQVLDPDANLGRLSVRLVSLQSWTHGLFILDLAHMPSNTCGVWPAVWMLGSGLWPTNGEIDIIEYVNNGQNNLMALHSTENCTVAGADESGTLLTSDCGAGDGFTGCTVSATQPDNSGDTFNANGGGVYAWEWTSTAISIWFFPRNAIPDSIGSGAPDVNTFGTPAANFEGNCDIDAHFYNASLLFDVDFCGSYAGNVWEANGCPMLDPENGWSSCNEYVALNPTAFDQTYWQVNYLQVFQAPSGVPTTMSSLSSVTPAISTSTAVSTALSAALGRTTSPTMSLAGKTPNITTGSFTATSSVLSVLSSLSSESEASASSVSSSLVGRATSPSSLSSMTSSGLLSSSVATSSEVFTSTGTIPSSTWSPGSISTPPASLVSSTTSCTGTVCTDNIYVTVVQTMTVAGITPRAIAAASLPRRVDKVAHDWNKFDRCDFNILPMTTSHDRWTEFACTLTREEIFDGHLVTETLVASTHIQSGTPLQFGNVLSIDHITMETRKTDRLTSMKDHAFTGSLKPSGTCIGSTTLTACPKGVGCGRSTTHTAKPPTTHFLQDKGPSSTIELSKRSISVSAPSNPTQSAPTQGFGFLPGAASMIKMPGVFLIASILITVAVIA